MLWYVSDKCASFWRRKKKEERRRGTRKQKRRREEDVGRGGDIREDKHGEVARAVQAAEERPHLSPEALMSGL